MPMLTIKDANQVRTMRQMKSYRSCPTSTGLPQWGAESGRRCQEEVSRCNRELRRQWRVATWRGRAGCCR
jgi:hypothetical protein